MNEERGIVAGTDNARPSGEERALLAHPKGLSRSLRSLVVSGGCAASDSERVRIFLDRTN
ncbi:hypothetical protein ACLBKU_08105 [Erythrobacter sp. NE805]|uniref:hypothetical protein n=1 Tax=Erythrobacter sp. NE805 TaxID=3389875 RepID=UPI00396AF295